ncbi:MAG: NUDIX domain-containing protein [Parachlamydiales bacterium]|jgi:ADP-ribose pyrophosphatase YjhB (NUDIX family)
MKTRHTNIPASYLILLKGQKTLLLQRANTGYEDGKYSLIAGHVEDGESFSATIIREAWEEAGVALKKEDLAVVHIMHRKSADSQRVDVFFFARKWEGEPSNKEPAKCASLDWFPLKELPENTIAYVKEALELMQKQVFYSERGWE